MNTKVILVMLVAVFLAGCTSKEYFYYNGNEKISLNYVGTVNDSLVFEDKSSGQKLTLGDTFIVQLKEGSTKEELDILNERYKVQISRNVLYAENQFILKVTPESGMSSLEMANRYHAESIIEWSQPNFLREYDLNR